MSQAEIDQALDALEAEHSEVIEQHEPKEDLKEVPKDKPPGFIGYDEWIAKGKDPADFKGENAYNAEYGRIQEIRELKDTMTKVVENTEVWKQQQIQDTNQKVEAARAEAQAELEQAKKDDDVEGALVAKDKINNLQSQQPQVNPLIADFSIKNPVIDPQSKQYDKDVHEDVIMLHNSNLDKLLGGDRSRANELTQGQISRSLSLAYKQAQEFHPDKFKKGRQTPPPGQRRGKDNNSTLKLKDYKGNSRNPRDSSPANDVYEMIKKSDPKAAEKFLENLERGDS